MDFRQNLTPAVKLSLVVLIAVYVAQLLVAPLVHTFAWFPGPSGVGGPWSPLTCLFFGGPDPGSALFDWLGIFFLLPLLERFMSMPRIVTTLLIFWAIAVGLGYAAVAVGLVTPSMVVGQTALLDGALALIGFHLRSAQFLFMFAIPMRASVLAWVSGGVSLLYLLAYGDLNAFTVFVCWCAGALWAHMQDGSFRYWKLLLKRKQVERKMRRFEVLDGGKDKDRPRPKRPDEWIN